MKVKIVHIILLVAVMIGLASCFPTRNVPDGSYLYTKSKFSIKGQKVKTHNISSYFLQKTNRKLLILRPYLWFYDLGTQFKDSSWTERFLTQTLGEPPALLDTNLIVSSAENIAQHLRNLGYYNVSIIPFVTRNNYLKTASVKYVIYPQKPYILQNISFDISDRKLKTFVLAEWGKSNLRSGEVFSSNQLKDERDRISMALRNLGYYYFNKQQISFEADSTLGSHAIDLKVHIENQQIKTADSSYYIESQQFKIKRIYIYPEMSNTDVETPYDTTIVIFDFDRHGEFQYFFIHRDKMAVNPKAILQSIFIKPNNLYKYDDIAQSYQSLFNMNIFKFINIKLNDLNEKVDNFGQLECIIQLSKLSALSISTDSELKNTGGDLGIEQSFGLVSRNTFRNGEIFSVNLRGALEVQNKTNSADPNSVLKIFNTFETGINTGLEIPRFFAPVKRNFFSRYFNPKTKMELGYNYQDRPDYTRTILNGSFGFRWVSGIYNSHIFNLIELSSVKILPEPEFQAIIDQYEDPRIKYSYQDHLVLALSYSYLYNEKKYQSKRPSRFFFGKVELGGIPYNLVSNVFGNEKDSLGQYWIGNLPYTQFLRFETDYRYYFPMMNNSLMHVFRANIGVGIPLSNSVATPFEKSFYIGGSNSLRAWTLGTLGPGSYNSRSNTFEMTGDIRLEINYEFRFPISDALKGSIFADAGNIFLIKQNDVMPEGVFHFYNFYQKMALDIGYGIRYDMSFLVLRFDIAHPLYQPYLAPGKRWSMMTQTTIPKLSTAFNFAIGYPF